MSAISSVAVRVGSLRKDSFSRKVAKALMALAPASLKLEIVEIGPLDERTEVSGPDTVGVPRPNRVVGRQSVRKHVPPRVMAMR